MGANSKGTPSMNLVWNHEYARTDPNWLNFLEGWVIEVLNFPLVFICSTWPFMQIHRGWSFYVLYHPRFLQENEINIKRPVCWLASLSEWLFSPIIPRKDRSIRKNLWKRNKFGNRNITQMCASTSLWYQDSIFLDTCIYFLYQFHLKNRNPLYFMRGMQEILVIITHLHLYLLYNPGLMFKQMVMSPIHPFNFCSQATTGFWYCIWW